MMSSVEVNGSRVILSSGAVQPGHNRFEMSTRWKGAIKFLIVFMIVLSWFKVILNVIRLLPRRGVEPPRDIIPTWS